MKIVGLTGGIGSGKSMASGFLREVGATLIDADYLVRVAQQRGQPAWREMWQAFGWRALKHDGQIARRRVGYIVFGNPQERQQLNGIMRPVIHAMVKNQIDHFRSLGGQVLVLDIPLLIEGGLHRIVDEIWLVYAQPEQQIQRVMARDQVSRETAQNRVAAQMPIDDKIPFATRIFDNTGSLGTLKREVLVAWHQTTGN